MDKYRHIHFIGIGGIGMSALARFFLHEKKKVTGSDHSVTPITCGLEALGIEVVREQVPENITDDIDLVIYTEAMVSDHPEVQAARKKGIKTTNYFEALGMVANEYYLIAVSGAHGKTTTTAMLTDILEEAGLDPTAIIGSLRSKTGSNFRPGKSKYAVVEACEYKKDFLHLKPDILVITNIEHEHVDYYKKLRDVQSAFRELAKQVREDGYTIANPSDPNVKPVLEGIEGNIVDYSKYFDPMLKLKQPGLHNQMNAAAAAAAATQIGVDRAITKRALENFAGTWRRFEYKGKVNGAPVYDDYAHHPTEIKAVINAAREKYPTSRLTAIFQSHTYTRTHELFDDFARELAKADRIILAPIYAAREENESGVDHQQLAAEIAKTNKNVAALDSFDDIVREVRESVSETDVVLVIGAGDITNVTEELLTLQPNTRHLV